MLLRFRVSNHRSIRETQELSMIASNKRDHERGLLPWPSPKERRVLPVAVIYGANASGKSAMLDAMETMRRMVRHSHQDAEPEAPIRRAAFLLDRKSLTAPTLFECDFIDRGQRFNYGFEINDAMVLREWLNAYPSGRKQALFSRNKQRFAYSRAFGGAKRVIAKLTRPNSLYVSVGAQNNHPVLKRIRAYFSSWDGDLQPLVTSDDVTGRLEDKELDSRVIGFLAELGTGTVDHRRQSRLLPKQLQEFALEFQKLLQKQIAQEKQRPPKPVTKETVVQLGHKATNGKTVYFDLNLESDGTRRLLALMGSVYQALDTGHLLVVDELNASLHTHACEKIINLFLSKRTNRRGAQLITTTHDTNLLNLSQLRRDEIWLMDKDEVGQSHLSSLVEFQTRRSDNRERGYLQGRFGAVPPRMPYGENAK